MIDFILSLFGVNIRYEVEFQLKTKNWAVVKKSFGRSVIVKTYKTKTDALKAMIDLKK